MTTHSTIFCDMAPCSLVAVLHILTNNLIYRMSFHCLFLVTILSFSTEQSLVFSLSSNHATTPHSPPTARTTQGLPSPPPRTPVLIIASVIYVETLKDLQNPMRSIPESQSHSQFRSILFEAAVRIVIIMSGAGSCYHTAREVPAAKGSETLSYKEQSLAKGTSFSVFERISLLKTIFI
jgi:hypothetical protein